MGSLAPQIAFTNVVVTTVKPLEKKAHVGSRDPTHFDMASMDFYVPTLSAYRLPENSDAMYVQAVTQIKDGLQKVLVPFFPWAGRWVATPGGTHRQLLCNDEGVPFIEVYLDENMDSVIQVSVEFQPVMELQGWDVLGMNKMTCTQQMRPDGLPCAFVQVTRFKCGGLTVAVTFNHMLSDGESFHHFMTAWSDLSRTNRTDKILEHSREAVQTSTPVPLDEASFTNTGCPRGKLKFYEVSASVIESIKREVRKSADGAYVSTNDCIYAHMWKIFASLPLSSTGGKQIIMGLSVEGRTRFHDPPVPNLVGNFVALMTPPKISNTDLVNMPLSVIGSKIREKLTATPREAWLSPEALGELKAILGNDKLMFLALSCWRTFPMYSVDYGFGNPLFVIGLNTDAAPMDGVVVTYPPTPSVSGSAAGIGILLKDPELLEALERHQDFQPFFLPQETVKSYTKGL